MELSLLLSREIGVLFLMALCGFLLVRLKLLSADGSRVFSVTTVYVLVPCTIIHAFQIDCTPERLNDFLVMVVAALLVHLLYIGICALLKRPFKLDGVERSSLIYTNCGNLIIPLVTALFGSEMVFYTCAYICVQTLLVWTHGRSLICSGSGQRADWKKILLSINVLSTIVGLILFITRIRLPLILEEACSGLGGIIGPVSMLIVGMLIGGADLKRVFTSTRAYFICLLRLIVLPMIVVLLFRVTGLTHLTSSPQVLMITTMAAAAPSGSTITQMAQLFDADEAKAATISILTTVLCIVTMPLMIQFYQWLI